MSEGEHELAITHLRRSFPLLRLGRLDEAEQVLKNCLTVFRGAGDPMGEARVLTALADLWDERKDYEQAKGLERQALAVFNRLTDLASRSSSHSNLAGYLHRLGAAEEAARHRLAGIVYILVIGHGGSLATLLHNLTTDMRHATASSEHYELPRLTELLTCPDFEPLQRTLTEWNVPLDELQAEVDKHVEAVRRQVEVTAAGGSTSPEGGESV